MVSLVSMSWSMSARCSAVDLTTCVSFPSCSFTRCKRESVRALLLRDVKGADPCLHSIPSFAASARQCCPPADPAPH